MNIGIQLGELTFHFRKREWVRAKPEYVSVSFKCGSIEEKLSWVGRYFCRSFEFNATLQSVHMNDQSTKIPPYQELSRQDLLYSNAFYSYDF